MSIINLVLIFIVKVIIGMSIVIHRPQHPALQPHVMCLWAVRTKITYQREKILPSGMIEWIINLGSPFRAIHAEAPQKENLHKASWLVGMQTGYLINEPLAETDVMGVRFYPGGQYPFLKVAAQDLHNQVVPMTLFWPQLIHDVREQLVEIDNLPERFAFLERVLLQRLDADMYTQSLIQATVRRLMLPQGSLSMKQLASDIGVSQKHLAHRFKQMVGIPPKTLARIFRFQQVLQTIDPTQPINWSAIAHHCHYHDQSHFNKEFKGFTELTPNQYIEARRAVFGEQLQQGESIHFVPIG